MRQEFGDDGKVSNSILRIQFQSGVLSFTVLDEAHAPFPAALKLRFVEKQ